MVQRANESLAEYQRMRMWLEWPEEDFPRTSTQKPRRNVIAEVVQGATAAGIRNFSRKRRREMGHSRPAEWAAGRVDCASLRSCRACACAKTRDLDSDLGLSSLDRVELLSALEDRYQVDLSETRFSAVRTVGDLERMLRGEQRRAWHITIRAGRCAGR